MGAQVVAPGGPDLPANQNVEAVERSALRAKKGRILDLYSAAPPEGVVVCFDELGPLELRPYQGSGWYQAGHPNRQRATYHRTQGTEQFLGFYDVHSDVLVGQVRKRKTHKALLAVFARLRACYDRETCIYLVMDNLNSHRHPKVKEFYEANNIEPIWTPT